MSPLTRIELPSANPEDILIDRDGAVLTGTEDGSIYRIDPASGDITAIANTGGRPLGLEFLPDRRILVRDAYKGLLAIDHKRHRGDAGRPDRRRTVDLLQ